MGFHFLVLKFLIMILWFMICVISNHNHTNHTIILRTFHYYCYKSLHYILLFINKVLSYMGFHFFYIEIPYYDFVICDFVIAIFSATLSASVFLGLVVAEAGVRWGLPPLAHNRLLTIFLWDSWLRASLQNLLLVYPEKCWFLKKSWLTLQTEKAKQPNNNTTASPSPSPLPQREGSD